jgi:hypothetical protein
MPEEIKSGDEYEIVVDYNEFLTRFDLDEVISSIDRIIESSIVPLFVEFPSYYPYEYIRDPIFSYVGIKGVSRGSMVLEIIISTAVVTYVARRFKKGVDVSLLADEIERSGRITGDFFGGLLQRLNNWGEQYVRKQREKGGNITRIQVRKRAGGKKDL